MNVNDILSFKIEINKGYSETAFLLKKDNLEYALVQPLYTKYYESIIFEDYRVVQHRRKINYDRK